MKLLAKLFLSLLLLTAVGSAFGQSSNAPASLVGKWFSGSTSLLQEENMTTGALTSRYGSSIGYVLNADGTYRYAGLMKSTMYNCTTTLWNDQRGKYTVDGDQITFTPSKDYWLNTNSCAPSSNKEQNKALKARTYDYEIAIKDGTERLFMREVGKTRPEDVISYPRSKD